MRLLRTFVMAAALAAGSVFAVVAPAHAQTLEETQRAGAWAAEYQRIVGVFLAPIQQPPEPPSPDMTRPQRLAWAAAAREWATGAQASFQTARADLRRLPPYPFTDSDGPELHAAIESAPVGLSESIDAGDRISSAYLALADAVERNQMDQITSIRLVVLDGAIVTMRLFRDINAAQAAALEPGNPNRPLTNSYAFSYEALRTILTFKRSVATGVDTREAAANALVSAAARMRAEIVAGRADVALLERQLNDPRVIEASDPGIVRQTRALVATFPQSFSREDLLAADIDAMAALLRQPGDFVAIEPSFDAVMEQFAVREAERTGDLQRRAAIQMGQ